MNMKNICIISNFGIQTYSEIYKAKSSFFKKDFWDFAIFKEKQPIDVVELFHIINKINYHGNERHVYINGIVLGNYFRQLGFNMNIINQFNYSSIEQKQLIKDSEVALISTSFVSGNWSNNLCLLINHIQKINPQIKIIVGGVGIFRLYEEGIRSKGYLDDIIKANPDYIIISRNGIEKVNLILSAESNYKKCQVILDNEPVFFPTPESYKMGHLPMELQSRHSTLLTSSGCIHSCAFCIYKFLNKQVRYLPIKDVFKCIENITQNRQVPLIHLRFADECFNEPEARTLEICNYLYRFHPHLNWSCFIRGDHISEKLVKSLKKAGCTMVSIGVESGDPEMQFIMRKNLNLSVLQKGVSLLKEYGIFVVFSLIIGFYGENKNSIENTIKFLLKCQPDLTRINIWTPSPGEENTLLAHKYGLVYKNKETGWAHNSMDQITATKRAIDVYKLANKTTFLPPFTSVFDQWPQLAAESLSPVEIFNYFNMYYNMSIGELSLPKGLKIGNLPH